MVEAVRGGVIIDGEVDVGEGGRSALELDVSGAGHGEGGGVAAGEAEGEADAVGEAEGVGVGSAYARPAPMPPARAALLTPAMMILVALFIEPVSGRIGPVRAATG